MQCSVEITGEIQKELTRKHRKFSISIFVLGLLGIFAYFAIKMFFDEFWVEVVFFVSMVLLVLGILMYAGYATSKSKVKGANVFNHYEFSATSLTITHQRNEDIATTVKVLYKNIKKVKDSENYLFIYVSRKAVLPVPKKNMTPEEISSLKVWINSERLGKSGKLEIFKNSNDENKPLTQEQIRKQAKIQAKQKKLMEKARKEQEKEEKRRIEQEKKQNKK